ncbi:RNA polymerase sigma factor SigJ [Ilumatobacter sp.]|uniref:RNA polymerase sigma factor SigJ n=1 Tax=Ilumatobacter sp. TaxID=1967498 RepID=UPI003C4648DF
MSAWLDAHGADPVAVFEEQRPRLRGLAYRMTGCPSDADDIVQDAWCRFADRHDDVTDPPAWLTTVVTRLSIDQLRSARHRREHYVGPWLAEPMIDPPSPDDDPGDRAVMIESITIGFLTVLEHLSPLERAVFVLHDVFSIPLSEIADIIERTPAATRQLAKRARDHLADDRPRFDPHPSQVRELTAMMLDAAASGDLETLESYLAEDIVHLSDGGAERRAARLPVVGRARVARFYANLARRLEPGTEIHLVSTNGQAALYLTHDGTPVMLFVPTWVDGRIAATHSLLNPAKLAPFHAAWIAAGAPSLP